MRYELFYDIHYELTKFLSNVGRLPALKDVDPVMFKWEQGLVDIMNRIYGKAGRRFLERLKAIGHLPSDTILAGFFEQEIVPSLEEIRDHLATVAPEIALDGRDIARRDLEKIGVELGAEGFSTIISTSISDASFLGTTIVIDNQKIEVMDLLQRGRNEGLTIRQMVDEMTNIVDLEDWQMRRIAVTEIGADRNIGADESYKEVGVEYKQWIARMIRTRDSHIFLHGKVVKFNERFITPSGAGLMYPLDRSAPLSEWINCHCIHLPYVPTVEESHQGTPFMGTK
jgi:SPP1 gp7 family putative phage head morphogenesis protein